MTAENRTVLANAPHADQHTSLSELRDVRIEIGTEHNALLRGWLISDADEHGRRRVTVHRDMRHFGRNEHIVAGMRKLAVFELLACVEFNRTTTQEVESG